MASLYVSSHHGQAGPANCCPVVGRRRLRKPSRRDLFQTLLVLVVVLIIGLLQSLFIFSPRLSKPQRLYYGSLQATERPDDDVALAVSDRQYDDDGQVKTNVVGEPMTLGADGIRSDNLLLSPDESSVDDPYGLLSPNIAMGLPYYAEECRRLRAFTEHYLSTALSSRAFSPATGKKGSLRSSSAKSYQIFERRMFPWLLPSDSLEDLYSSFRGKGIVMTLANDHVGMVAGFLRILRTGLKSNLPVELFYNGTELSQANRERLEAFANVQTRDINLLVQGIELHRWGVKPFAMLFSSFREVVLVDADAVLVEDPSKEGFLEDEEYLRTGTLFFLDRNFVEKNKDDNRDWIRSLMDESRLTDFTLQNRWMRNYRHMIESGVVVLDKARNFPALLATCKLNQWHEIYTKMHGEKETFWIGHAVIGSESYTFNPQFASPIGDLRREEEKDRAPVFNEAGEEVYEVCSAQVAHADRRGERLLWWNGGFVECKYDAESPVKKVDLFLLSTQEEAPWEGQLCHRFCMRSTGPLMRLSEAEKARLESLGQLWKEERQTTAQVHP